ncbi:hypothetical protein CHS0354_031815 [Potamilus streckersoni]|uniref:C2H2-type domain-containing protein n=1 Tax=Potamilus streckersoni TaxID=2493646 RepID=A0AAE0RXF1_9BIVA|nr:hypothetical protein CHS0354_031815 [Potamilus streckersoni]
MISGADIQNIGIINLCDSFPQELDAAKCETRSPQAHDRHPIPEAENPLACRYCGKTFSRTFYRREHERIHTGEKPYTCAFCGRRFNNQGSCAKHERRHCFPLGTEKHECNICKATFNAAYSLKVHKRKHFQTESISCDNCGKVFGIEAALRRHVLRFHTEDKPFKCNFCHKSYVTSYDLRIHNRSHTGERPYKCRICRRGFITNRQRTIHERTHMKKNRHHCTICATVFRSTIALNSHMVKVHKFIPRDLPESLSTQTDRRQSDMKIRIPELAQQDIRVGSVTRPDSICEQIHLNRTVNIAQPQILTGNRNIQNAMVEPGVPETFGENEASLQGKSQIKKSPSLVRNLKTTETLQSLHLTQTSSCSNESIHVYVKTEPNTDHLSHENQSPQTAYTWEGFGRSFSNRGEGSRAAENIAVEASTSTGSSPNVSSIDLITGRNQGTLAADTMCTRSNPDRTVTPSSGHETNTSLAELLHMRSSIFPRQTNSRLVMTHKPQKFKRGTNSLVKEQECRLITHDVMLHDKPLPSRLEYIDIWVAPRHKESSLGITLAALKHDSL